MSTDRTSVTIIWLGRAGLLPYLGLPAALYLDPHHQSFWAQSLATYTLAIICFLVGAWWGLALIRRSPLALVLSNALVLAAFFGHLLLTPPLFFLLGAVLFLVILLMERRHHMFQRQPHYYWRLRLQLSLIAILSLLASIPVVL
jgi:hypothetical protein